MRHLFQFLGVVIVLASGTSVYGWGGPTHAQLAGIVLKDPVIAPLVPESCDVKVVRRFVGEPPKRTWHSPGWGTIRDRGYLPNHKGKQDWSSLDETTRVKYLIHIAVDCGVPLNHSPAGEVYKDKIAEGVLEAQVSTWLTYPSIVGTSCYENCETGYTETFTGTYAEVAEKCHAACHENAKWLKGRPKPWYLQKAHSPADNRIASQNGTTIGLYLGRAMLADLFLSEKPTVANANGKYKVKPGESVTLCSAGSCDPDSITWKEDGTYVNNGDGFQCEWDLDGDGKFETVGAAPKLSHAQLVAKGITPGQWQTICLKVVDDEGKAASDTAKLYLEK